MEFSFEAKVVLELEHKKDSTFSKHVATKFNMSVSKNLDKKKYINEKDLPTKEGSIILSNILIQGLVGNIHFANDNKYRDSAEHLRWIISELERGFAAVSTVEVDKL